MSKKKGSLGAWFSALFGCRKKHILDGPGMVNDLPWKAFSLSRTDSCVQYHFWFDVRQSDFAFLLTGQCRGDTGEELELEEGAELSAKDLRYLRELRLGELSDAVEAEDDDGLFLLDAPVITFVLTYLDGKEQKKAISSELSMQIYQRFLPYFQKTN